MIKNKINLINGHFYLLFKTMRTLTDEEASIFFEKLSKYIGWVFLQTTSSNFFISSNIKHLIVRED